MNSLLFSPLKLRGLELKNRIVMSPMCQYSAKDGVPGPWHMVHLGSRAVGGASVVICEATSVSPEGRISPGDTGIWNENQVQAFSEITEFIKSQDCIPGIQLAHAGRKASTKKPWDGHGMALPNDGGWTPVAPSPLSFSDSSATPKELSRQEISEVVEQFSLATKNALKAGFQIAEIHMAHGYLLNQFLSPLSNHRTDDYGGSIENRMRLPLQVAREIRKVWPSSWPVFARISVTDWVEGGWTSEDSVLLCKELKTMGIDLIDCSSGGSSPHAQIKVGPGYQVELSEVIRRQSQIATGAVGVITEAKQAEDILKKGQADMVFIGRELLRDPYWPLHAARELHQEVPWPKQYLRAKP